MAWKIVHHEKLGIIETIIEGRLSKEDMVEAAKATINEGIKQNVSSFLSNVSNLHESGNLLDLYEVVKLYKTLGVQPNWRKAVLIPNKSQIVEKMKFYESVSQTRGFKIKVFSDYNEATDWLTVSSYVSGKHLVS